MNDATDLEAAWEAVHAATPPGVDRRATML